MVRAAVSAVSRMQQRVRSTVDFSYFDLENSINIVRAIAELGGTQASWESVAKQVGMPLEVVAIDDGAIAKHYGAPLVLVRPDGHVAWRGTRIDDGTGLLDTVRGA